jgi:uncharacterized membrane protein YgaE (UPF0421/DUF939 family)
MEVFSVVACVVGACVVDAMEVFSVVACVVVACVVGACVRVSSVVATLVVIACVLGFSVGDFVGMASEVVLFVVTTSVDDPVVAAMLGDEQIINFIQIQRNTFTQTQECNKVFDPNISNEKIMRLSKSIYYDKI